MHHIASRGDDKLYQTVCVFRDQKIICDFINREKNGRKLFDFHQVWGHIKNNQGLHIGKIAFGYRIFSSRADQQMLQIHEAVFMCILKRLEWHSNIDI
jgi:hypothetical protein